MGFYGDPMADAFNPMMANATTRLGQQLDYQTAKKKRFMDLLNQGIQSAAGLKQQQMIDQTAVEKATADNQAAADLANSKAASDLKMEEYKQKTSAQQLSNIKTLVEIKKAMGEEISAEDWAGWGRQLGMENNNPGIASIFNGTTAAPAAITPGVPTPQAQPQAPSAAPVESTIPKSVVPTNITSRNLIKNAEGYKTTPYYDKDGYAVGYGSKRNLDGSPIDPGRKYTPEELQAMFERDVTTTENAIDKLVKVPLSPVQKASLTSFVYNTSLGNETFAGSTLLKKLNAGDYQGAGSEMTRWINSKGKSGRLEPDQGLISRRAKEKELFVNSQPVPEPQWQAIPDSAPQPLAPPQAPTSPQEAQALAIPAKIGPFNVDAIRASSAMSTKERQADLMKVEAQAAKDNAEANFQNMTAGIIGDGGGVGAKVPSTPEEAAALAEKVGLTTRRPLKDPYEELAFTNKGDPSLQVGSTGAPEAEPLKYRGSNGKLVQYQPNQKLLDALNQENIRHAFAFQTPTTALKYLDDRRDVVTKISELASFRTKAKELITTLNPNDLKTNLKADTFKYIAELADSGALDEEAIRSSFAGIPKDKQTKAVSAIYTMLGSLAAYARTKGEVGVISDGDIKRYSKLLIHLGSSPAVNRQKLLDLYNEINSKAANEFAKRGMSSNANEYIEEANWARPQLGYPHWDYDDGIGQKEESDGSTTYYPSKSGGAGATSTSSSNLTPGGRRRF